jgi:CO/xanthine dehydrogenase Mo-binding subunit
VGTPRKPSVGSSLTRVEGLGKVNGSTKYIADLNFPNQLFGGTVRTKLPRGRVRAVVFEPGIPWKEFTVVTASDVPGANAIRCLVADQPCLVDKDFMHAEEAVVLLAHPDPAMLHKGLAAVTLHEEASTPVLSLDDAAAGTEIIHGTDNNLKKFVIDKGCVDEVWSTAFKIVEGEYRTGAQEQMYIETHGVIAVANKKDGVTIWGSLQCPYYVQKALMEVFNLPPEKTRVVQTETGGGFGGKEDYPSILSAHAALLALKSGKPVKMIYDRREDMAATTKRHPSRTRHRTAIDRDGKLLAMEIEFILDGGAYTTLSPVVVSRGGLHAAGAYCCPHVRVKTRAVATNTPPHGAFRGFGAPQSLFAVERHMEKVARAAGLTSEEFRRRNFVHTGEQMSTGQTVRDCVDLDVLLQRALEASDFVKKRERFSVENKVSPLKKGIGLSVFMHGAGFTGSGESYLGSVAAVEATADGKFRALAANTEIGQGKNTVFTQIVADALHVDPSFVEVAQPDTKFVPNSGPTVASRSTMIVGKLLQDAAIGLRQTLVQGGYVGKEFSSEELSKAAARYVKKFGRLKNYAEFQLPAHINWDDVNYRGDAYSTFAWAVYVAEVEVDSRTFEARVTNFTALQEIGRVVNPTLAAGQIEGGVTQGIGYALYENCIYKNGRMINNQMSNYIIPTSYETPPIQVLFEEVPCPWGPGGAKGIGELPLDGPAPAIINAVENAIGVPVDQIPATPEVIMKAMLSREKNSDLKSNGGVQ